MNKWMKVGIGVTAGLMLFTACSKSDNSGGGSTTTTGATTATTTTTTSAGTVSASAFAASVCGGVDTYLTDIQTLSTQFSSSLDPTGTPSDQLKAVADYLDQVVAATDDLIASLQSAGVPDVSGGQEAVDALTQAYTQARDALQSARDQLDSLPTNDPAAFATALQQLGTDIQNSMSGVDTSFSGLTSGEVAQAFASDPTCQSLGVGSTTTSP